MEADLARFYGIDYRDRWRHDDNGRRRLTLRMIYVRLSHLPPESAVMTLERDSKPVWSVEAHLLDDVRMVLSSSEKHPARPHPDRPVKRRAAPSRERARKLAAARKRARARQRAKDTGEL